MGETLIIAGGRVLDPATGEDEVRDVIVSGRVFAKDVPHGASPLRYDARGKWVMPGLIDVHAHFREPGHIEAETLLSGAQAAAHGGFTQIVTMPNTQPPRDAPERIAAERDVSSRLPVELWPAGCCTVGRAGEQPAPLRALYVAGARAVTDDGATVARDDVMEQVMREAAALDIVVMDHAVNPAIAQNGIIRDCAVARRHALAVFPAEAEVKAVERDIALAKKTGCRLHLQHLSCKQSVALLAKARREGVAVTGEATPHHLALSTEDIPGDDAAWKMNPPLGTPEDVAALRAAVKDGVITICATDHAPHGAAAKAGGFATGAFGVIGLETAVGASMKALMEEGSVSLLQWVACWTTAPAALLKLPTPSLAPGNRADATIVAPEHYRFDRSMIASKSCNTPFLNRELFGRVTATLRGGVFTYKERI